jgi:hypothetical protein
MRKEGSFLLLAPPHPPALAWRPRSWWPLPLALGLGVVASPSCGGGETPAILEEILPSSAYNGARVAAQIRGQHLRPPLSVDTHTGSAEVAALFQIFLDPVAPVAGRRSVAATEVVWKSELEIDASLPEGLLPGSYHVGLRDPRGNLVPSLVVFTSLGPDNDPPQITFLLPSAGATVAPDTQIAVEARVDDGPGHVAQGSWSVRSPTLGLQTGTCTIDPSDRRCRFSFFTPTTPTPIEAIDIQVDVDDSVLNHASASLQMNVAWSPDITTVDPAIGPTTGGTPILVHGSRLIAGLSQVLIDGLAIGGSIAGDAIRAFSPPHIPGVATVRVGNGDSLSAPLSFTFIAPPTLRLVSPTHAPGDQDVALMVAGNSFRPQTRFFWIQDGYVHPITSYSAAPTANPSDPEDPSSPSWPPPPPAPYAMWISEHRCTITLAPGAGVITLRAHDEVSGDSTLLDAFTYDPPP